MTVAQPYRALRILLFLISAIEGIAGAVLIFGSSWVMSITSTPFLLAGTGFVFALLKGIGIIMLALGYLSCVAARDPVRYAAIIDTLIFLLVAAAVLNLYAVAALHIGAYYPGPYLVVRAILQLALAAVILVLRPKAGAIQAA
jgi:hypothetical protein